MSVQNDFESPDHVSAPPEQPVSAAVITECENASAVLETRRQHRIARAQRRRRRHTITLWSLVVLLLLAAVFVAIYHFSSGGFHTNAQGSDSENAQSSAQYTNVTISAVGDLHINQQIMDSCRQADGSYDFNDCFLDVSPILSKADITLANLENNFCGEPYTPENGNVPESLLSALGNAGIDLIQTANSYTIQNGLSGLESTLSYIHAAGLGTVGSYATQSERKQNNGVTVVEIHGVRIAFAAFTKGMNNLSLPAGSEYCVNLLYEDYDTNYTTVDTAAIEDVMKAARASKAEIIIALVHWGSEYETAISSTQEEIADLLFKNGADAIIGTHSHIVGSMQKHTITTEEGTEKEVFTAYSLGNFFAEEDEEDARAGVVLNLDFSRNNWTGEITLTDVSYDPIYTVQETDENGKTTFKVINTKTAISLYETNYFDRVSDETYEKLIASLAALDGAMDENTTVDSSE